VLDADFALPEAVVWRGADVIRPITPSVEWMQGREWSVLNVVGRLAPGATLEDAAREAERVAEARAQAFPDRYVDREGAVGTLPVVALQEATVGRVRQGLGLLLGAVTLLLLVACANVTHLFLARGVARVREMSVRRALGAGTGTIAGQLLVESLLLGIGGAVLGIALAQVALLAFKAVDPGGLPRVASIAIDTRIVAFAALTGTATAVVFGLLPALRLAHGSVADVLRAATRTSTGSRAAQAARTGIVIAEVALSLVLIAQAGWLLRSLVRVMSEPLGFRTENVITIPLTVPRTETPEEWHRRMEAVRASLAATPGVRQATFGLSMPLEFTGGGRCCWSTRADFTGVGEGPNQMIHPVSATYFEVLDLAMRAGRPWAEAESAAQPRPAVVTEPLAVQIFGSAERAVGRTFEMGGETFLITGVAVDNRHYGADQSHGPAVYVPVEALPFAPFRAHMAVLTDGGAPGIAAALRAAVWRVEPTLPVPTIRPLAEWATAATARARFESTLFLVFGAVALCLLAGGLSGTLLYMVSLQRRDLGIRLALGATAARLERRVLLRGLTMAAAGAVLGAAGAWATGRLIESRLFGVDARDLRTLALATGLLLMTALVSSWVPARRAASTDPMESLRVE
jgi:predicted permease